MYSFAHVRTYIHTYVFIYYSWHKWTHSFHYTHECTRTKWTYLMYRTHCQTREYTSGLIPSVALVEDTVKRVSREEAYLGGRSYRRRRCWPVIVRRREEEHDRLDRYAGPSFACIALQLGQKWVNRPLAVYTGHGHTREALRRSKSKVFSSPPPLPPWL